LEVCDVKRGAIVLAVCVALCVPACSPKANVSGDSRLDPVKVYRDKKTHTARITLSGDAARRLDIKRAHVVEMEGATAVPYAALLYTSDGKTWVFTNPAPLEFVRAAVVVNDIRGDVALLRHGPPAGTTVVTTGAAELLGAESGVGEA
jgi:hypothetical protein